MLVIALTGIFLLTEFLFQFFLGYPPTIEQLKLGIDSPALLWGSRILGLTLTATAFFVFAKLIKKKSRMFFLLFLAGSPTMAFLWTSSPVDTLKISIIAVSFYLAGKIKGNLFKYGIPLATVLFLNLIVFNQKPEFVKFLNPNGNQSEVTHRFTTEDKLKPNVGIPTPLRRIGYNKYYLSLKNIGNLSMPFFNLETLFFQEVHPRHQKATVLFFWPQIFIFFFGLWVIVSGKSEQKQLITLLLVASFLYFITTNTSIERRLVLLIPTISLILVEAMHSKKTAWQKRFVVLVMCLSLYGWATNVFDRTMRPGYWYDNRPMVYDFAFTTINKTEEKKKIVFSETLYSAKDYCPYYKGPCEMIGIEDFRFGGNNLPEPGILYVGFLGNFLGPNPESNFPGDFTQALDKAGLRIISTMRTHDNIANTYGQDVVIAEAKQ